VKVVSHSRYVAFQMAEAAIPRDLFADILRMIAELRPSPVLPPAAFTETVPPGPVNVTTAINAEARE
jgi:hypothetical protein